MSDTQQRTLTGAAGGAAGGAAIGAIAGNAGLGAALGGVAGAAGGYIWDQHKKSENSAYQRGVAAGQKQQTTN
ncbi:glycine zipper domain-containing protein [Dongia soli]|uniref:Glycine zipper domain-containing protein n=2 Tax=Dongia soli TaxID=600628 RepID=A0ABU5EFE9_9PROT|nr:glycine zipper domain-containing protein [Dongia soli]